MTCSIRHDNSWTVKKIITFDDNNTHKQQQGEQKDTFLKSCLQMKYWLNYSDCHKKDKMKKISIK